MIGNLKPGELLIILFIVILLFGAKRLPDTARGLGRSLRILKAETKGLRDDEDDAGGEVVTPPAHVAPVDPRPIQNAPAAPVVPPGAANQVSGPGQQDAVER